MSSSIKIYAGLSVITIIGSAVYRLSPLFIENTINLDLIVSEDYQYLRNFDNDKFSNWKVNFSLFRKTISNNIPILQKVKDSATGGYLLKKWCSEKINNRFKDKEDLKLIKKYCVVNLKNLFLKEQNVKTIDDVKPEERKKFFESKKDACKQKLLKDLLKWCNANFKLAYLPKNKLVINDVRTCCLINI